jgi:glyoxylase-like metal-dependent hydrolase (beta-lactamase superfamily II)
MTSSYEVLAVRYATRDCRSSDVFLNFPVYGEPDAEMVMDYFFWVVRGNGRVVVVDTGFTPEVGEPRGRRMTCPVPQGLERIGVDPADVDTVVVTHGHYDHTGHVRIFPSARVVISGVEYAFWTSPMARRSQFGHSAQWSDIETLQRLEEDGRLQRMAGSHEIAPGITALEVGGHTPGQLIVTVDGQGGQVLLASDAVHYYDEVLLDRPFLIVADLPRMYQAFDTISTMAKSPGTAFVAGHDPLVFDRFPALDERDRGFGVRAG